MGMMDSLPSFLPQSVKAKFKEIGKGFSDLAVWIKINRRSNIKISWDHPSPSNPDLKGLLAKDLGKEYDFEYFWTEFCAELIKAMEGAIRLQGKEPVTEPGSHGLDFIIKASAEDTKPDCVLRMDKEAALIELRSTAAPWTTKYKVHRSVTPFCLEAWGENIQVPNYWHAGILLEKQSILDEVLRRIHPDIKGSSAKMSEEFCPSRPWTSTIVSEPLDAFADFDLFWDKLLDFFKNPSYIEKFKIQNVTPDGFTVFNKGSGNRSSWSWTKYRYDKYAVEDGPKLVGPAVEHTLGEIVGEAYSAWRELLFRSHIVVHKRPLRLEFWGETLTGTGPRMKDPLPVVYFGLLCIFGNMNVKKQKALQEAEKAEPQPAAGSRSCCRRNRTCAAGAAAGDKEKDD